MDDGAGRPASYLVRFFRGTMDWGTATEVSQGTCSVPMPGQSIGASRDCVVEGLAPATQYEFQLVPFRGTLHVDAVFGPLSNVARGTTAGGGIADAGTAAGPDAGGAIADAGAISGPDAGASPGILLFSESFENDSYASRGWYDNTTQGTIVAGGQTGKCLQWAWANGAASPTNGGSTRMNFTPTDSLYISLYVKFQTGWRGSQKTYHPHLFYILSDLDRAANVYSPLANNYLDTYIEFLSDVGSPYAIRPIIAIQDEKRVNTSHGTPPNNLTAITENRSVAYCNTPVSAGAMGICYADNPYYSANSWKASAASISTNSWHHVEVYFKMNSISGGKGRADGVMQKWIDGSLVIDHSDVLYRTAQDANKK
ncbi:MAG: hypothetical protein HY901_04840, partial [Deltaproteobacteria bacterium]|nr:hypothetical protein [Deltaproteobacteria bacterium]